MLGADAAFRDRVGQRLHVPVPAHAEVPPRPRAVRRRRRASRQPVRRARRQQRRAGCRQPGVEARAGAARPGARRAARHLRQRARRRRRREHPATRRARPTSSRRRARFRARSATRCWRSRARHPFARTLVNSGRLSVPTVLADSPLNTPDARRVRGRDGARRAGGRCAGVAVPAATGCCDIWAGFDLLVFGDARRRRCCARPRPAAGSRAASSQVGGTTAARGTLIDDKAGLVAARYDARRGTCYLIRPDQHVCARWRRFDAGAVRAAIARDHAVALM